MDWAPWGNFSEWFQMHLRCIEPHIYPFSYPIMCTGLLYRCTFEHVLYICDVQEQLDKFKGLNPYASLLQLVTTEFMLSNMVSLELYEMQMKQTLHISLPSFIGSMSKKHNNLTLYTNTYSENPELTIWDYNYFLQINELQDWSKKCRTNSCSQYRDCAAKCPQSRKALTSFLLQSICHIGIWNQQTELPSTITENQQVDYPSNEIQALTQACP